MGQKKIFFVMENIISFIKKFILALFFCVLCRALTNRDNYYLFFIAVVLFAIPMTKYACYKTTITRKYKLQDYKEDKKIPSWKKIRWPFYLWNGFYSTILAFFLTVYVTVISKNEALALGIIILTIIMLYLIIGLAKKRFKIGRGEYRLFGWQKWIIIIFGTIAYPILLWFLGGINSSLTSIFSVNKIAFVIEGIFNGINTFSYAILNNDLSRELNSSFYVSFSIFVLHGGILFYSLTNYFLSWFITKEQQNEIIQPIKLNESIEELVQNELEDFSSQFASKNKDNLTPGQIRALAKLEKSQKEKVEAEKAKVEKRKIFVKQFFLITVLILFMLLIYWGVYCICNHKDWATFVVDKTTLVTEVIEGEIYRLGTTAKYNLLGEEFAADTKDELIEAVNLYFDKMILNTENYLDWYYSLGREYSELFTYLGGIVENQLEERVSAFLGKNFEEKILPDYKIDEQLDTIFEEKYLEFNAAKKLLFDENRINNPGKLYQISIKTTGVDIIAKTGKPDAIISGKSKFIVMASGGTVAGVASSIITTKLLAKLSTKLTQKAATQVLTAATNATIKKTASSAITGTIGGVVGTMAGPVGTVVGVVVGVAASLGIDILMLEIDEAVNREDYKNDIISCIEEERQYYLSLVDNQIQETFM